LLVFKDYNEATLLASLFTS